MQLYKYGRGAISTLPCTEYNHISKFFRHIDNTMATIVKQGPCGGLGGSNKIEMGTGVNSKLLAIRICHGDDITAIQLKYEADGERIWSPVWGNDGEELDSFDLIKLAPGEKLTSITGYVGTSGDYDVIKSLTFVSTFTVYGPYGTKDGIPFTLSAGKEGEIVGFHGQWGGLLDSLGIFVAQE